MEDKQPLAPAAGAAPLEFLAFTLGAEEYGVDIQHVQELRGYDSVTHIANTPAYLKGVINLRGIIVPIVDLRIRLGQDDPGYDQFTVVIILNLGARTVGMVVDSVSDVITLDATQIKPAPEMGAAVATDYVTGIGTVGDRMLILADIERLVGSSELQLLERAAA